MSITEDSTTFCTHLENILAILPSTYAAAKVEFLGSSENLKTKMQRNLNVRGYNVFMERKWQR